MKKLSLLLLSLAVLGLIGIQNTVYSQEVSLSGSFYDNNDLVVTLGVGSSWTGLAFFPGAEYIIGEIPLSDKAGLDFGIAGRGILGFGSYLTEAYTVFGAGVFAVFHFGLKNSDVRFFKNLDFYWGPGVKFDSFSWATAYYNTTYIGGFGFSTIGGINYFFNENFALMLEGNYFTYGGANIGVLYRF